MSGYGVQWAWDQEGVTANERLVLLALGHAHGWRDWRCFIGTKKLAEQTRLDRRTVQRQITALTRKGVIEILVGGGRGRANEYLLVGLNDARKGGTVPQYEEENSGRLPPFECENSGTVPLFHGEQSAAPVQESAAPVHEKGGTVPPPPGIHQVTPGGGRAGAREEPPPPDPLLTAEEFIADVDDGTRAELAAARPDLVDHLDRFLGNFAEKRSGTGRRTRGTWLEILWDWWRREERRGRTDGQEAWERIRPQLANSARASTEDPIAAAVVADMGGFAALGRLSAYQLDHAGRDFVARYRTAARSPQQARHGPIGLARPGPDPKQHGDAMP